MITKQLLRDWSACWSDADIAAKFGLFVLSLCMSASRGDRQERRRVRQWRRERLVLPGNRRRT